MSQIVDYRPSPWRAQVERAERAEAEVETLKSALARLAKAAYEQGYKHGLAALQEVEVSPPNLPTREQLLAVMGAATRAGDAQGMHDALALLALVSPTDAEAILAAIEARSAELKS